MTTPSGQRRTTLRFLLDATRAERPVVVAGLAATTFVSLSSLVYPLLLKGMIDRFTEGAGTGGSVWPVLAGLAVVFAVSTALGYSSQVAMQRAGFALRNRLRERLFAALLARDMRAQRLQKTGELSARATEDVGRLQPLFAQIVAPLWQHALVMAGCLALMIALHPVATLCVLALLAAPLPFLPIVGRRILNAFGAATAGHARANAIFEEALAGVREIKAYGREATEVRRYAGLHDEALDHEMGATRLQAGLQQTVFLILSIMLLAIFAAGTTRFLFPDWSAGGAVAFYLYAYTLTMAAVSGGKVYLSAQGISGALERTRRLIEAPGERKPERSSALRKPLAGALEFRTVRFSYETGRFVLHDLSFSMDAGEWLLITGGSGSGKSTLAQLIAGLYDPDGGEILFDGIASAQWDEAHLRKSIGYVPQEPVLFSGSLRENILFAAPDLGRERLEAILHASRVHEFAEELPDGLETVVGERGYTLSGGQKSRVAIARALALDPAILILDEANSMLETDLERRLWEGLASEREGKSTLILGHHGELIPGHARVLSLDAVAASASDGRG